MKTSPSIVRLLESYARHHKSIVVECRVCGISFVKSKTEAHGDNLCIVCEAAEKKRKKVQAQYQRKNRVAVCAICHQVFIKKSDNQKYCSRQCLRQRQYQYRYGIGRCIVCGRFFSRKKMTQQCCSPPCALKHRKKTSGFVSPNLKEQVLAKERRQRINECMTNHTAEVRRNG